MPRAKQRTPELRDRLLEVAIATLSEEGIARFTTRRVAERAGTSVPAVYELFDDKAGLVRAMFFEGFRLLGGELAKVPVTADPVADLERLVPVFRLFCRAYPRLAQVMFSRPFADFEPGPEELAAGASVREVARQLGVNPGTLCRWQRRYGGVQIDEARRMFLLEKENLRLKKIVADLELDKSILKEALDGKY